MLCEPLWRTEGEGERAGDWAKPLLQIGQPDPAELILSAQRHVCRDEPVLHRVHTAPKFVEGIPDGPRNEEAELAANRQLGAHTQRRAPRRSSSNQLSTTTFGVDSSRSIGDTSRKRDPSGVTS